jgi:hypothetical protein
MTSRDDAERLLAGLELGRPAYARRGKTHLGDLGLRLREAALWCERNLDLNSIGNCLRPRRIAPQFLPRDRWQAVDDVVILRRQEIGRSDADTGRRAAGRLLVYFPELDLTDGAAEAVSQEFFDAYNAPPWGTWVAYFKDLDRNDCCSSYLLAWVPEALAGVATAGIDANPEQCITWLEDAGVGVLRVIEFLEVPR